MRKLSATAVLAVALLGIGLAVFVYLIFMHPVRRTTGIDPNLVAADTPTAPLIQSPAPAPYSRIAFASDRDGNMEIYTMAPDGSDLLRLTTNKTFDFSPQWSPDGTRIAWFSEQGRHYDLYVMNSDGSGVIRLTDTSESKYPFRWSPDGSQIAYGEAGGKAGASNLFVIPSGGGKPSLISDHLTGDFDWSPDGTAIAFATRLQGTWAVLNVANVATHEPIARLAKQVSGQLDWSPVNSDIAYIVNASAIELRTSAIHVFDPVSGEQRDFVNAETNANHLVWSPHGSYLAYARVERDTPQVQIYVVNAAGENPTFVAGADDPQGLFDWSPDETQIVYVSMGDDGQYHISVAPRDQPGGENESIAVGMNPDWSPPLPASIAHLPSLTPPPPTATPTPLPTVTPAPTGMQTRIVFVSGRNGNSDIYTMNPDGSDRVRLTHGNGFNMLPAWSPDGTRITWEAWQEHGADLYVMNADGSNPIRLTNTPEYEDSPKWSPDGQWIAYASVHNFARTLHLVGSDGSSEPRKVAIPPISDYQWSPDGTGLWYNTSGGKLLRYDLSTQESEDMLPTFEQFRGSFALSPDGSRLAISLANGTEEEGTNIYLIDLATGEQTLLLESTKDWYSSLLWSPDGNYLAYEVTRYMSSRDPQIEVLPVHGGSPVQVLTVPPPPAQPIYFESAAWSPDSRQLVFVAEGTQWNLHCIVVVDRDGTVLRKITDGSTYDQMPDWSPYLPASAP